MRTLVVAAVLLAPMSALAQGAAVLDAPGESAPVEVDPEIVALRGAPPPLPPTVSFARSFVNGLGGFGLGATVGFAAGISAGVALEQGSDVVGFGYIVAPGIGAAILAPLGAGLGVWGFGELRDGGGNAFASIGGAYLGAGIGVGLGFALIDLPPLGYILGPIVGAILTPIGAAAGYHLSGGGSVPQASASSEVSVVPYLAPPQQGEGAVLGASGLF